MGKVAGEMLTEMRQLSGHTRARPKTSLIVNADDLGVNQGINDAIFDLIAQGRVTSASMVANGSRVREAATLTQHFPDCSFGIHLNVTEFEPLSTGDEGLLLDADGRLSRNIEHAGPRPQVMRAIFCELCAQMDLLLGLGVAVDHIDSHHHVHTIPMFFPLLKAIQMRYGIRRVRISKNIYSADQRVRFGLWQRKRLFNWAVRNLYTTRTTQGFTDLLSFHQAALERNLDYRSVEIMVHPGAIGSAQETELLRCDMGEWIDRPVRVVNYKRF